VFLPWEKELPGAEFCPANAGWEDFVRSWDRSREVFVGVLVDYFHLIKKLKLVRAKIKTKINF
jgi:hypothetical protein